MIFTALTSKLSASLIFALGNLLAGVLNYTFNLYGARQLDLVAFGQFNTWLAYVSVAHVVGSFSLFLSNFYFSKPKTLALTIGSVLFLSIFAYVGLIFTTAETAPWLAAIASVAIGVLGSWVVGQLQTRQMFGVIGLIILITAISKLSFAWLGVTILGGASSFYWSLPAASFPAFLVLLIFMLRRMPDSSPPVAQIPTNMTKAAMSAMILSFTFVFLPQMDILYVHWTQDQETVGRFAHVSLIYKAVFFSLTILAQLLLPSQIKAARAGDTLFQQMHQLKLVPIVFAVAIAVSMTASLTAPMLQFISPPLGDPTLKTWIFMSCFNMTMLSAVLFVLQNYAAATRIRPAAICIAVLLGALGACYLLQASVQNYLLTMVGVQLMLLTGLSIQKNS